MYTWKWAWDVGSFTAAFLFGIFMIAWQMPRRKHFWLRFVLCLVFFVGYLFAWTAIMPSLPRQIGSLNMLPKSMITYLLQYVLGVVVILVCYDTNVWASLFCATSAYCLEHIGQRLSIIISRNIFTGIPYWWCAVILLATNVAVYLLTYFFLVKKQKGQLSKIVVDRKFQILLSLVGLAFMIILNWKIVSLSAKENMKLASFFMAVLTITVAFLILQFQFVMLKAKSDENSVKQLNVILKENEDQYRFEKSMIDAVNIKCHDLKHQRSFGKAENAGKDAENAVSIYDSIFDTGNPALDTVLTNKMFLCNEKGIKLSCFVNAECLHFMEETDIYNLFGNVIDNAVDAVTKLTDKEKKCINLTVCQKNSFAWVCCENYFSGNALSIKEGLPQTTKDDGLNHGFGMPSIRLITDKYEGDMKVVIREDRFLVDLLFPI